MNNAATKPRLHLRVAVTDRCQFRCQYCMPAEGLAMRTCGDILRFEDIAAFVQQLLSAFDIQKIRLTGGDPLVRPDLPVLVRILADLGIPQLALTADTGAALPADTAAPRAGSLGTALPRALTRRTARRHCRFHCPLQYTVLRRVHTPALDVGRSDDGLPGTRGRQRQYPSAPANRQSE